MDEVVRLNSLLDITTTKTMIKIVEDNKEIYSGFPQNYERKNVIVHYNSSIEIERDYYVQSQSVKNNVLVISVY